MKRYNMKVSCQHQASSGLAKVTTYTETYDYRVEISRPELGRTSCSFSCPICSKQLTLNILSKREVLRRQMRGGIAGCVFGISSALAMFLAGAPAAVVIIMSIVFGGMMAAMIIACRKGVEINSFCGFKETLSDLGDVAKSTVTGYICFHFCEKPTELNGETSEEEFRIIQPPSSETTPVGEKSSGGSSSKA